MKKRNLFLSIFTPLLLLTAGCNSDYLDTTPTEFLTPELLEEAAENNPDILRGTISGIYTLMFETATGGTGDHTDFGQKGVDIWTDMLSGDMALTTNTYNWYRNFVDYQSTVDFTRNENYIPWRYYYRIIRSTNIVIEALGGNDAIPSSAENRWLMGQAKAMRGYAYFYLAQIYTREYDPTREILPLYIQTTQQSLPKSSTADVYALIESDLTDAIDLMSDFTRTSKNQVDQNVAKALLAYTYAAMGNNEDAFLLTEEIINTGAYPLTSTAELTGGFNNVNTSPSWMWGVDLTTDQGLDLISWWGQMDLFTYSYQWAGDSKGIDRTLFNSIPADDVRKTQFDAQLRPVNKFYDPNRVIGGQRVIVSDYVYMRIDEIYLLNAEAASKTGRETQAQNRLIELLSTRIPSTAYISALTGDQLKDEIYKQTRIELWGEGKSYLAMKRNQKTITRGTNHLFQSNVAVPYNDPRLKFSIPQAEILNNINISEQN